MQTFLPFASFRESAKCLDYRRLGKQRVECKQILLALGVPVGEHRSYAKSSWSRHPACQMWKRHEVSLAEYGIAICDEWIRRGYKDTLRPQFVEVRHNILCDATFGIDHPNWIGWDSFHASHRSNLLRKDRSWYGQFGWGEPADLPYVWPAQAEVVA